MHAIKKFVQNSISVLMILGMTLEGNGVFAQGQAPSDSGVFIPMIPPATLSMTKLTEDLNNQINQCELKNQVSSLTKGVDLKKSAEGGADLLTKDKSEKTTDKVKRIIDEAKGKKNKGTASGDCYDAKYEGKFTEANATDSEMCALGCEMPEADPASGCSAFFASEDSQDEKGKTAIQDAIKKYSVYKTFQGFKAKCGNQALEGLKKQRDAYLCERDALKLAAGNVAAMMKGAIAQNQMTFGKYNQMAGDLMTQVGDIEAVLGGEQSDPHHGKPQFGGLLGIQEAIKNAETQNDNDQEKFKQDSSQIVADTKTAKRKFDEARMDSVSSCLSLDGNQALEGKGYKCNKEGFSTPQDCSASEYLKTILVQSQWMGGRPPKGSAREAAAYRVGADFESLIKAIQSDIAGSSSKSSAGGVQSGSSGVPSNYNDLVQRYSAQLGRIEAESKKLSRKPVSLVNEFKKVASSCFQRLEKQKVGVSDYEDAMKKVSDNRGTLTRALNTSMSKINSLIGDAWTVLNPGGKRISYDRSACTTNDEVKMLDCHEKMKNNLQQLKESNAPAPLSARQIKAGSGAAPFNVKGFAIPCRSIDDCVNQYQARRDQKRNQFKEVVKVQTNFVSNGNNGLQTQLQNFGTMLGGFQDRVMSRFGQLAATMIAPPFGIEADLMPKTIEAEALTQVPPPNPPNPGGPFGPPKNPMAGIASFMSTPLIDFSNDGFAQAYSQVDGKLKENAKSSSEGLKELSEKQKGLGDLLKTCGKSDSVGSSPCTANACQGLNAGGCTGATDTATINLILIAKNTVYSKAEETQKSQKVQDGLMALEGISGCEDIRNKCRKCLDYKGKSFNPNNSEKSESNKSDLGG